MSGSWRLPDRCGMGLTAKFVIFVIVVVAISAAYVAAALA